MHSKDCVVKIACQRLLITMDCHDLLVGKGRLKVGSSGLRTVDSNDLLVGKGMLKVGINRLRAMVSSHLLFGKGQSNECQWFAPWQR